MARRDGRQPPFKSLAATLAAVWLAAGCTGQPPPSSAPPSAAPSLATRPTASSPAPMRSGPMPHDVGCDAIIAKQQGRFDDGSLPPPPQVKVAGGDAASAAAVGRALESLKTLRSYRYRLNVLGRDITTLTPSDIDLAVRATLDRSTDLAIDGVLGTAIVETNGTGAAVSGSQAIKAGHGFLWSTDNVSEVLEPTSDPRSLATIDLLTPEGAASQFVTPFAAGYRRVGAERHAGIPTEHYRASTKGLAAYASTLAFNGKLSVDAWIASDGGFFVGARVKGTGSHIDPSSGLTIDEGFMFEFEITNANDPGNVVTLPATPVPDPVRPSEPPVDLMLTYRVLPLDGREPTATDLQDIGVALRTRLDISDRPVKVDTKGVDQVEVTVCGTTRAGADRRLVTSHGALNVVPLPKDRYGTSSSPGSAPLPAVGTQLDPSLAPIAPPKGLGLTTAHVDPETGQRGLALMLGNQASEAFRTYAAGHRGEFVAVVLDGTVLATLPIDDRTARAHFVFTGDYTEAETRLLASYLYRDPILFDLRPVEDVEIPATSR